MSSIFAAMPPTPPSSSLIKTPAIPTLIKGMLEQMNKCNFDAPILVFCAYFLHLLALNLLLGYALFPDAYQKYVLSSPAMLPTFLLFNFLPYYLLSFAFGIDCLVDNNVQEVNEKLTPERSHIAFLIKLLRLLRIFCYLGTTLFCIAFFIAFLSGHLALPKNPMELFDQKCFNNFNETHFTANKQYRNETQLRNGTNEPMEQFGEQCCWDYFLAWLYGINFFGSQQIDFWWYLLFLFVMRGHMHLFHKDLLYIAIFFISSTSIIGLLIPPIFVFVYVQPFC